MENLKVKVNDEAESKEVQELLSYLDYNGKPYLLTNEKMREETCSDDYEIGFLFAERGGNASCLHKTETKYFDDHPYEEITLQKLKDLAVLKRNSIDDAIIKDTFTTPNTTTQDKLKFIEKWLNGEKIQYILGVESEKTQWHNFTEGAMQYIKRSDIKFREAPKYVTINGIEFKSVKSLLKHVKNNFDLEDGE